MPLKAAIQFPLQRPDSFDIILSLVRQLGRQYILGHSQMQNPFSVRLVPQENRFLGEIWVPLTGRAEIETALELFTQLNFIIRKAHPDMPSLQESGTRYGLANKTAWFTTPLLYDRRVGDCKDIASARVADLRFGGELGAKCHLKRVSVAQWHVQVRRADGRIEDPCLALGMREYLRRERE